MSGAQTPVPVVNIEGRRVTVTFDLPFIVGDVCITPNHYEETYVSRIPEIAIRLENNLKNVRIECQGSWYTASHNQMHGLAQFLPTKAAFLDYWLAEKYRSHIEARIKDLNRLFKDDPQALTRIKSRHVEMLQAEIAAEKAVLGNSIVLSTQKVIALEAAIAKATGGAA